MNVKPKSQTVNNMADDTRPPSHRTNSIKAGLHILEHSNAEPLQKINACLLALYPEDIETIQKSFIQTLNTLNQKIWVIK